MTVTADAGILGSRDSPSQTFLWQELGLFFQGNSGSLCWGRVRPGLLRCGFLRGSRVLRRWGVDSTRATAAPRGPQWKERAWRGATFHSQGLTFPGCPRGSSCPSTAAPWPRRTAREGPQRAPSQPGLQSSGNLRPGRLRMEVELLMWERGAAGSPGETHRVNCTFLRPPRPRRRRPGWDSAGDNRMASIQFLEQTQKLAPQTFGNRIQSALVTPRTTQEESFYFVCVSRSSRHNPALVTGLGADWPPSQRPCPVGRRATCVAAESSAKTQGRQPPG